MITLSPRLRAVYNEILPCRRLVDVGCDHGMIVVKAVLDGVAKSAMAVDISLDSLNKARLLASKYGVMNIQFHCADGISSIDISESDTIVVAGVGGLEIIKILSRSSINASRYVLMPHRNTVELRQYLALNSVLIIKDEVIVDKGHYYNLLTCSGKSYSVPTEKAIFLGNNDINSTVYRDYIMHLAAINAVKLEHACNENDRKLSFYIYKELLK